MKEILTPCILQTIIICCTIISLAMIAVSAFRVWKEKEKHDSGTYIFITGAIVFIAIAIFSYGFYQSSEILSFISLASSLISIILAVVTIIYSFYTNNRSASQVEKLNEAADDVKVAANDVKAAATSYNESAESLQENIKKIINAIERVEQKTDKLLSDGNASSAGGENILQGFDVNLYIANYIKISSPLGIMALYACIKAKEHNKSFRLELLGNDRVASYCGGFLVATISSGIISAIIDFNNNNKVSVVTYLDNVKTCVEDWLSTAVGAFDFVKELKGSIDRYFAEDETNK